MFDNTKQTKKSIDNKSGAYTNCMEKSFMFIGLNEYLMMQIHYLIDAANYMIGVTD